MLQRCYRDILNNKTSQKCLDTNYKYIYLGLLTLLDNSNKQGKKSIELLKP